MNYENTLRLAQLMALTFNGVADRDFPFPVEVLNENFGLSIAALNDHHVKLVTPYRDSVTFDTQMAKEGHRETWVGVRNPGERYELGVLVNDFSGGENEEKRLELRQLVLMWKMGEKNAPMQTFRLLADGPELVVQMARYMGKPELRVHFLNTLIAMQTSNLFDMRSLALLGACLATAQISS